MSDLIERLEYTAEVGIFTASLENRHATFAEAATRIRMLEDALRRIGTRKLGGPWAAGQIAGERREMIEIARAALKDKM